MAKNIVLVGFMGTGKTSIGKVLAKKLNRPVIDVDHLIEERAKKKISDIFEKEGEAYFRSLEKNVIRGTVAGCGGLGGFGGGLLAFFDHSLNLCELDSLHEVFELGNGRAELRRQRLVPGDNRTTEQLPRLFCQAW